MLDMSKPLSTQPAEQDQIKMMKAAMKILEIASERKFNQSLKA